MLAPLPKRAWQILVGTVRGFVADNAMSFGAAISFYAVVSIAPLVLIAVAVAGMIYGDLTARHELTATVAQVAGSEGAAVVETIIQNASGPGSGYAAAIGAFVLLASASAVFNQLRLALRTIFNLPPPREGWRGAVLNRAFALGGVLVLGGASLASVASGTVVARMHATAKLVVPGYGDPDEVMGTALAQALDLAVVTFAFFLVFLFLFGVLSGARIPARCLIVGALVTAVLFNLGRSLMALYLARSAVANSFGAAGSLVIFLLWIYYTSLVMLLGAEFTKAYAKARGTTVRPHFRRPEPV